MKKRKVLGKGIDSIISDKPAISGEQIQKIEISNVYPNPYQPRKTFEKDKIEELAASISDTGLIQPVVVFEKEKKFYLIVGERRWRAVQHLKWEKIPAIIKDFNEQEIMIGAMVENIQREDLNAVEIGEGINQIMIKYELNQEKVAEKMGMSRSNVANYLRILRLPVRVKEGLVEKKISFGHARAISAMKSDSDIGFVYDKIVKDKLSVRQTEKFAKQFYEMPLEKDVKVDPDLKKTEEKLAKHFSTKVKLSYSKNGKGKVEIYFSKLVEFERIYNLFVKEQ